MWRDVPVVLGGPHPTILPDESLQLGPVDVVARGEGEVTWQALSDVLAERWVTGTPFRGTTSGLFEDGSPAFEQLEGGIIQTSLR